MARTRSASDPYLLTKVSSLYYERGQTQQEIADRLHLSRPKVSRLLQEAQECGIVQITVTRPAGVHVPLETGLEERFGLAEAQVVGVEPDATSETIRRQLGAAAAAYLVRTVQPGASIGLAWGTTLNAMVQAMPPLPTSGVTVVQTLGGIGPPEAEAYAAALVRRLAQLLQASPVLLPAPGIVGTAAARDVLRDDPHVKWALQHLDGLDVAYVGIGSLRTNPVLNDGYSLPSGTYAELESGGAIGDIALRFFDAAGRILRTSLDDRILGISTEQLRRVTRVVAVAGGADKADAIHAALEAGLVHVLITDHVTAGTLVERAAPVSQAARAERGCGPRSCTPWRTSTRAGCAT
jgi:DNA-binding transcriptional regulator LsrR (DeoR family)